MISIWKPSASIWPSEATTSKLARAISPRPAAFLSSGPRSRTSWLITDEHVQEPHAMQVGRKPRRAGLDVDVISIDPGEASKSLDVAASLWQGLLELGADRKTVVAAVGGGVVGDLAGFIAATYARGLRFCKCPRRCWPRSIARSAARWASTCPRRRTWSARSCSRWAC